VNLTLEEERRRGRMVVGHVIILLHD
jgi:hypothetical protein